jgi:hypothetical protein
LGDFFIRSLQNHSTIFIKRTMSKTTKWTADAPAVQKFMRDSVHPLKQFLFLFMKLPGAMFFGIRLRKISPSESLVTVPFRWSTKNPYRSMYFATQCAAGEFATGALATMALQGRPSTAILVANMRAEFFKKAATTISFTCNQGAEVIETVNKAIETGEAKDITMIATGSDTSGTVVSKIYITWTFKKRSRK